MNKKFNYTKKRLEKLYRNNSSIKIGKLLSLDATTIQYWLHKYDIPIKESSTYKRTLGYLHTDITKRKIAKSRLGKHHTQETKDLISQTKRIRGSHSKERNGRWIDGRTSLRDSIRHLPEYKIWIKSVFKRDNYTCQHCNKRGNLQLEAHHIITFNILLNKFLQRYSTLSVIKDKFILLDLIRNDADMFDVSNGLTLCKDCHNLTKTTIKDIK